MDLKNVNNIVKTSHPNATDEEIQAAFESIDTDALTAAETSRWAHEVWDRTTPINGVPAADVLAKRNDIPATGEVVIVKHDGKLVMFQPHDPSQPGFAPIVDGASTGAEMASQSVAQSVDSQILQLVATALTEPQSS
jgi:hypothetical protein